MNKFIVSKVSKLSSEDVKTTFGANVDLAVILPTEDGKMSIITPRMKDENGNAKLTLSKKDLKELTKLLKDEEDDGASIALDIMISSTTEE